MLTDFQKIMIKKRMLQTEERKKKGGLHIKIRRDS